MNNKTIAELTTELDGISVELETLTELIEYLSICMACGKEAPNTILERPTAELVNISDRLGEAVKALYGMQRNN